jgi:hypothetical protein
MSSWFKRVLRADAWLLAAALALQGCGGGGGDDPAPAPNPPANPPAPGVTAPSALSYASPQTYPVGTAITALTPTVTGTVTSYAVAPALPAGLALDATTGAISGTPTAATPKATYTVTATNAGGSTTFGLELTTQYDRATTDRTDEASGRQVHVMYVLPSDSPDDSLDINGTLEGSVRAWNKWFAEQTGGKKIRLDTYANGKLDVSFLRLAKTNAEMSAANANVRTKIEYALLANGFDSPDKIYLVYYGGTGDVCGKSAWPPSLHGKVSAVYKSSPTGNCNSVPYAAENGTPGYPEFIAVHEVLHALGFAPQCAPHLAGLGHTNDGATDLMNASGQSWNPAVLDLNHDDYFGSAVPGCIALQDSDFLDPSPASPQLPPGWPYTTLTDLGCANELTTVPGTGADTQMIIVNNYAPGGTGTPVIISERVGSVRSFRVTIPYLEGFTLPTNANPLKENAVLVVSTGSLNGPCLAVLRATSGPSRFAVK